jgi:ATP-binding cassette, subfamily B, bacterial MsbA
MPLSLWILDKLGLSSLRRLFAEFRPYQGRLGVVVGLGIVIAAIQPASIRLTQQIIDGLKLGQANEALRTIPFILIGLFLLSGLAKYFYNTIRRYIAEKIIISLRDRLYGKYLELPMPELEARRSGDMLSTMQNDLAQIATGMETLCDVLREPFTFLGLLGAAFYCDWRLTLFTLLAAPFIVFLFDRSGRAVRRYMDRNLVFFGDLMALSQETIAGARIVKTFRLEALLREKFRAIHDRYFTTLWKTVRVQEISTPAVEFMGALLMAGVIYYGSHRASQGLLTSGQLIAFIIAIGLCQMPIKKLNNAYLRLKVAEAAVQRVYGTLELPVPSLGNHAEREVTFKDSIRFENVLLRYGAKTALDGVSFEVKRGEVLALVGPSGSGKSSIVNLLPRLYEATSGRVLIDGRDTKEMSLPSLRALFSFVTQDIFLFHDSIYENIRFGRPEATREQIIEAARRSHCLDFIGRCPQGLDTVIGDRGLCLSGGERQRIAIARAILADAPLLILDEATSSLDSHSEALVQEALEELMEGKTTFLVAHRFSTISRADRILVLEHGRIHQAGTHADLVASEGLYQGLYRRQSLPI